MKPKKIYAIQHNVTGRIYIGSTRDIDKRYRNHIYDLRKGNHGIEDMQKDFDEFGEDYSIHILDEYTDPEDRAKEYQYMEEYQSYVRGIGYNYKDKVFAKKSVEVPLKPGKPKKIGGKT